MRKFICLALFLFVLQLYAKTPKTGIWRGILLLDSTAKLELPFNFEVKWQNKKIVLIIRNAEERIIVKELNQKKDSLIFKMPVFDSEFRTVCYGDSIQGVWINYARKDKNKIPFKAFWNQTARFTFLPEKRNPFFNGKWECTFSPGTADSSKAIALFKQETAYADGTFLTETGDYRYLEGMKIGNKLYLSCFDGAHAFLFIAESDGVAITNGDFYSGMHWHEKWIARRNEQFQLTPADSITRLTKEFKTIDFVFENTEDKKISLNDERYKNKVVIIQLMGSWCPNCMDESAYFAQLYKSYKNKGLEVIALAYERTTDKAKSKSNLLRLKKQFGIEYELLITGLSGKESASKSLPMLNSVSAFPTTLFLDKKKIVRKIHTGFSGPATGEAYEKFKKQTEALINELLLEK